MTIAASSTVAALAYDTDERFDKMPTPLLEAELKKTEGGLNRQKHKEKQLTDGLRVLQTRFAKNERRLPAAKNERIESPLMEGITEIGPNTPPERAQRISEENARIESANKAAEAKKAALEEEISELERLIPEDKERIQALRDELENIHPIILKLSARRIAIIEELKRRTDKVRSGGNAELWERAELGTGTKLTGDMDPSKVKKRKKKAVRAPQPSQE